jgi:hypothetical protein
MCMIARATDNDIKRDIPVKCGDNVWRDIGTDMEGTSTDVTPVYQTDIRMRRKLTNIIILK